MRSTIVRAVTAVALAAAVAGCSAPATTAAPTTATAAAAPTTDAPAPTSAAADPATDPGADRAAVEKTFADYNTALLARDFATACGLTAPEATQALINAIAAQGAQVTTCEQAFGAVYAVPQASEPLDSAARTAAIEDVVFSGDTATVTFSGEAAGRRRTGLTNKMQKIDGQWKLLGNGA